MFTTYIVANKKALSKTFSKLSHVLHINQQKKQLAPLRHMENDPNRGTALHSNK